MILMANKYLNLAGAKELAKQLKVHVGSSAPANPVSGSVWLRLDGGELAAVMVYNTGTGIWPGSSTYPGTSQYPSHGGWAEYPVRSN